MRTIATEYNFTFKSSIIAESFSTKDNLEPTPLTHDDPLFGYRVYSAGEESTIPDFQYHALVKDGQILGRFMDRDKRIIHYTIDISDVEKITEIKLNETRKVIHRNR